MHQKKRRTVGEKDFHKFEFLGEIYGRNVSLARLGACPTPANLYRPANVPNAAKWLIMVFPKDFEGE